MLLLLLWWWWWLASILLESVVRVESDQSAADVPELGGRLRVAGRRRGPAGPAVGEEFARNAGHFVGHGQVDRRLGPLPRRLFRKKERKSRALSIHLSSFYLLPTDIDCHNQWRKVK